MDSKSNRLHLDIMADWRELVLGNLNTYGLQHDLNKSTEDLFLQLLHFQRRCVERRRRTVVEAKEFSCPTDLEDGYNKFKEKVKSGEDLLPHLSTRIEMLKTRDHALNDWGVHHFHMGAASDARNPSFVERTGDILFAVVKSDMFYSVGFWPHEFENRQILDIIQNNWPALIAQARCNSVIGMENENKTAEELRQLRQAGIMTLQKVGSNYVLSPGGGYTSTGDNTLDVQILHRTLHALKRIPSLLENVLDFHISQARLAELKITLPCTLKMEELSMSMAIFREPRSGLGFYVALCAKR